VIHVTNTNSYGTGSLEAACNTSGAKIIVFDVSGVIDRANQPLYLNSNTTLAGQTSPSGITVINGGIAGYTLEEEWLMINNLLLPFLDIDYIVLYSGFNDIKQYCRGEKKRAMAKNWSLPQLTPPKWLLTVELITKNTVFLRNIAAGSAESIDPNSVDMSDYEASLENLIGGVAKTDVPMTVLTNARSFRTDMPRDMQLKLSETAIYYNECFDLDGLHLIYDRHNQLIVAVAERNGFHAVDTMQFLPGGSRYFADATHFSIVGSDTVAAALSQLLKPAIEKL